MLIRSYLDAVAHATGLLAASGIVLPTSNDGWAATAIGPRGELVNGARYQKHGYGCDVTAGDWSVDFDFGDCGEIDGFDEWRLAIFLTNNPCSVGSMTGDHLRESFHAAVAAGEVVYSGHHLYYLKRAPLSIS